MGVIEFVDMLIDRFTNLGKSVPDDLTPGSPPPLAQGLTAIEQAMENLATRAIPDLRMELMGLGEGRGDTYEMNLNIQTEEREPSIIQNAEVARALFIPG